MATETKTQDQSTKVVTGLVRFSYLHVFKPTRVSEDSEDEKYSVSLIIPKKDKETIAKIKAAIDIATKQGVAGKWNGKKPANMKPVLRDGDEEREDDPAYAGSYFITASSKTKPGLIDRDKEPITDDTDLVSGDWGRASVTFYPYNVGVNKGVACGLNHLQKLKTGEPLGGRGRAEDDFDDEYELDEEDADDLI
jgi:hypothetical protein